jgi:hypothetical protein
LKEYLAAMARFHRYNVMLIASQRPTQLGLLAIKHGGSLAGM